MKRKNRKLFATVLFSFSLALSGNVFASPTPSTGSPTNSDVCLSGGQSLPIDDHTVIQWKTSTNNQFLSRAHISGIITKLYPDHSGHTHFEVDLDQDPRDGIEIIYNQSFGALPTLVVGMQVEACGDYITSNAPSGSYPASPDGAILHWVHRNPQGHGHDSGFVKVNGVLYGQENGNGN